MPKGVDCPGGCSRDGDVCDCENPSLFDPGAQISKLFADAQFEELTNISALADWKFWESFAFWGVVGLTFFYVGTSLYVWKGIPKYDLLSRPNAFLTKWKRFGSAAIVRNVMEYTYGSCFLCNIYKL